MSEKLEQLRDQIINKYQENFGIWSALILYLLFTLQRISYLTAILLLISCISGVIIIVSPVVGHISEQGGAKYIFVTTIGLICVLPLFGLEHGGGIGVLILVGIAYGIASVDKPIQDHTSSIEYLLHQNRHFTFRHIYPEEGYHEDEYDDNMHAAITDEGMRSAAAENYNSPEISPTNSFEEPLVNQKGSSSKFSVNPALGLRNVSPTKRLSLVSEDRSGSNSPKAEEKIQAKDQNIPSHDLSLTKYFIEAVSDPQEIPTGESTPSDKFSTRAIITQQEATRLIERLKGLR